MTKEQLIKLSGIDVHKLTTSMPSAFMEKCYDAGIDPLALYAGWIHDTPYGRPLPMSELWEMVHAQKPVDLEARFKNAVVDMVSQLGKSTSMTTCAQLIDKAMAMALQLKAVADKQEIKLLKLDHAMVMLLMPNILHALEWTTKQCNKCDGNGEIASNTFDEPPAPCPKCGDIHGMIAELKELQ